MTEPSTWDAPDPAARRKRRRRRVLLFSLAGAALLLLLLLALAPPIASRFVPGIVQSAAASSLSGKLSVRSASLSWFGRQSLGTINITDSTGEQVATLDASVSRGLFGLLTGALGFSSLDAGTVKLSGSAAFVRYPDGTSTLDRLLKPAAATSPAPRASGKQPAPSLPASLAATLSIDALDLRIDDRSEAAPFAARLSALAGSITYAKGKAEINLRARAEDLSGRAASPAGSLSIAGTITNLADAKGSLTPGAASLDAKLRLEGLSLALVDAITGQPQTVRGLLGPSLDLAADLKGSTSAADASLKANAEHLAVDLAFSLAGGVLSTPRPGTIALRHGGAPPNIPALRDALTQSNVSIDKFPSLTLTVASLRVPLPADGKPLDLRTASIAASLDSTEAAGTVPVPGPQGPTPQPFRVAPLSIRLDAPDLAKSITVKGQTTATLAGKPAGTLTIDAAAFDPLDARGAPRPGMPGRVQGAIMLTGVATAIAQPMLARSGVDLAADVGPALDLTLRAAAEGDPQDGTLAAATTKPPTHLAAEIKSANLNAIARLLIEGNLVRTKPKGIELSIASAAPLVSRLAKDAGLSIASGAGVKATITNLSADLDRLAAKPNPDLRGLSGSLALSTTAARGSLTLAGQPAKSLDLVPASLSLNLADLAKGIDTSLRAAASLDGKPAGSLELNLSLTGILDAKGAPAATLPTPVGTLSLKGLNTALAQPFLADTGIDLIAGIGPSADASLSFAAAGKPEPADLLPRFDADLAITSAGLNSTGLFTLDGRAFRSRAAGIEVIANSVGPLVAGAATKSGWTVASSGPVRFTLRNVNIPLTKDGAPALDLATIEAQVSTGNLAAAPIVPTGATPIEPVQIKQFILAARLAPKAPPTIDLRTSGSHADAAFYAKAAFELTGLGLAAGQPMFDPARFRPAGSLDIGGVPASLAAFADPTQPAQFTRLFREAVGPTLGLKLDSTRRAGDAIDLSLAVVAQRLKGELRGSMDPKALAIARCDFRTSVTPELAAALIEMSAGSLDSTPTLSGPATLVLAAEPATIPLAGLTPDWARAGRLVAQVGLEGKTTITNVITKAPDGSSRDLGPLTLRDILAKLDFPLASLAPASSNASPKSASVTVAGSILGAADAPLATLNAAAKADLLAGAPRGPASADLALNLVDVARLDSLIGQPGLLAGAVGNTLELSTAFRARFDPPPASPTTPKPDAKSAETTTAAPSSPLTAGTLTASIKAPRLTTQQPLKASISSDKLSLDAPLIIACTVDPAWADRFLLGEGAKPPANPATAPPPAATTLFDDQVQLRAAVTRLGLSLGPTPLAPGAFALDVQLSAPSVALRVVPPPPPPPKRDGLLGRLGGTPPAAAAPAPAPTKVLFKGFSARVASNNTPGVLGFNITIDDAGQGPNPNKKPAVVFEGGLYNLADASGKLTSDAALLSLTGDAFGLPTALLDALAKQNNLLNEALGPTMNLRVKTEGASAQSGRIDAYALSPRAEATIKGTIKGGQFIADGPAEFSLKEITPSLGGMLVEGLPIIGKFEKRRDDGPASVRATGLTVPIDNDLRKLNGVVVIDIKQARFETSNVFGQLVKLAGQRTEGTVGRRLDPLTVTFKDGVATYARYKLKLGEFTVDTQGTVDLVNRNLDIVTFLPFGALTDEAAGAFNTGLGRLLGGLVPALEQATMVPFRTKGSFDSPATSPDMDLFFKEAGRSLLRPGQVIQGGLEDLFKNLGGGGK
ncbi:MAG: hypothetical protein JNM80_07555 [Phycisphaerae bacterium]|nr:hypothetical protein [Phycisphaerae bacterium]